MTTRSWLENCKKSLMLVETDLVSSPLKRVE
jgi:hypothetical protein